MHGCRVCDSDRLTDAQSLSCGHRFCRECLLALLPNSSCPVSALPQHTAIIVCPRCRRRCEYSQVLETDGRKDDGPAKGDRRAPSCVYYMDDAEKKKRTKRAQFVQAYRKENGYLNRKSRSRFQDDRDDKIMRPEHYQFSPTRGSEWRAQSLVGAPTPKDRIDGGNEEMVDIRAIDHVNGRFVTCKIIQSSVQDITRDNSTTLKINQQPKLPRLSDYHCKYNNRAIDNVEPIKVTRLSVPTRDKLKCSSSGSKQRAFLVLLVVLFIVIVTMTSLISNPSYSKFG